MNSCADIQYQLVSNILYELDLQDKLYRLDEKGVTCNVRLRCQRSLKPIETYFKFRFEIKSDIGHLSLF